MEEFGGEEQERVSSPLTADVSLGNRGAAGVGTAVTAVTFAAVPGVTVAVFVLVAFVTTVGEVGAVIADDVVVVPLIVFNFVAAAAASFVL